MFSEWLTMVPIVLFWGSAFAWAVRRLIGEALGARVDAQRRLALVEAEHAAELTDQLLQAHRKQQRAQIAFELSVADLLLAADRFTVHPEFVRLWRNGQSLEWLLNSEERREFVDALGLPFDSLERPTPAQRAALPRGRVVEQSQPERGDKQCAEPGVEVIGEVLRILSHAHNGSTIAGGQPERPSVGAREAVAIGKVVDVSRAQYDEMPVKDPRTFYRIIDAPKPTMLMRKRDYEALIVEARNRRSGVWVADLYSGPARVADNVPLYEPGDL